MDKRISDLNSVITPIDSDLLAIVNSGETKKITYGNLMPAGVGGSGMGWARYDDSQYTQASTLTLSASQVVTLPNNGNITIDTYMNSSVDFYNPSTQKIQMENDGDVYSMVVVFKAKASNANQTHMELSLSATGATPYDRVSKSLIFAKGNNIWENYYESFHFYSDVDFVATGNQWKLTTIGGFVEIADVIYFIQRTFNAG
jgi:hypothetical protein